MNAPDAQTAAVWNAEYAAGRYLGEPPVPFVTDVIAAARAYGATAGLDLGCGNGRNLQALIAAGIDITGLDISTTAINHLQQRLPERADQLICGTLTDLPPDQRWPLVVAIQVLQHGDRAASHAFVAAAQRRVSTPGLFAVRVNAIGTDIWPAHQVVEEHPDGGLTVQYTAGPKTGELIHFFSEAELTGLFAGWIQVLPIRSDSTARQPPGEGQWTQWEAIWRSPQPRTPLRSAPAQASTRGGRRAPAPTGRALRAQPVDELIADAAITMPAVDLALLDLPHEGFVSAGTTLAAAYANHSGPRDDPRLVHPRRHTTTANAWPTRKQTQ